MRKRDFHIGVTICNINVISTLQFIDNAMFLTISMQMYVPPQKPQLPPHLF